MTPAREDQWRQLQQAEVMAALQLQQPTHPVHAGFPRDCHRTDGRGERLRRLRLRQRRCLAQDHWLMPSQPPQQLQVRPLLVEAGIAWLASRAEVAGETWLAAVSG